MKMFFTILKNEMRSFGGINILIHTKDSSEKRRRTLLLCAYAVVFAAIAGYIAISSYMLAKYGGGRYIPTLFTLLSALFSLFFASFRAKGTLYREKDLWLVSSLPLRSTPIAAARTLKLYADCLLITAVIILPSFITYAVMEKAGVLFCILIPFIIIILPILPSALAAWTGILFAAVIAKSKHKVLAEVMIALFLMSVFFIPMSLFSSVGSGGEDLKIVFSSSDDVSRKEAEKKLAELTGNMIAELENNIPALKSWGRIWDGNNIPALFIYATISAAALLLTVCLIGRSLFKLSNRLKNAAFHHDYDLKELPKHSALSALTRKEAARYFSSGIYVSNTIIAPIMLLAFSVALLFVDPAALIKGKTPVDLNVTGALPFFLSLPVCVMGTTSVSVSIEGNNWWILKSLPVKSSDVFKAKLRFQLELYLPFYLLSEVILLFFVRTGIVTKLWFLLLPLVYIVFSAVWGLFLNIKFPKFSWESETEIVKQSASVGISILGIFAVIIPGAVTALVPSEFCEVACLLFMVILCGFTRLMYKKVMGTELAAV